MNKPYGVKQKEAKKSHTKKKMTTLWIEPRTRDGHRVKAISTTQLVSLLTHVNMTFIYTYE